MSSSSEGVTGCMTYNFFDPGLVTFPLSHFTKIAYNSLLLYPMFLMDPKDHRPVS